MQTCVTRRAALVIPLVTACVGSHAEEYWACQYGDFDITSVGTKAFAANVAHNVARFDSALSRILNINSTYRVPTRIYVLSSADMKQLLGDDSAASYHYSGFDVTVMASFSRDADAYWGVYFGYAGGLLISERAVRYPNWLLIGVPEVFADASFERGNIRTGGVSPGYAATYLRGTPIPMRTFLSLQRGDPQLRSGPYRQIYDAEAWFLTREIFVESKYQPEFLQYLSLMSRGTGEREAFAASFKISYEELDKVLAAAVHERAHVYVVPVAKEAAVSGTPMPLSRSEFKGRLAGLMVRHGHRDVALRLAAEALQGEPANVHALCASARAHLEDEDYAASLADIDRLSAQHLSSAEAYAERAAILAGLAAAVAGKHAALAADAATLNHRAHEDYQRAIDLDAEDLRAWAGMAQLYASMRDAEGAKTFLPNAEQVLERHPRNPGLPRALTHMCAVTGQIDCAFRFAEYWRVNALTDADRDGANAYLSRLKTAPPVGPAPAGGPATH